MQNLGKKYNTFFANMLKLFYCDSIHGKKYTYLKKIKMDFSLRLKY